MLKVELVYDRNCPNVELARENLLLAFARLSLAPKWTEWDKNSDDSPAYTRNFGSPTILVNEKDCLGNCATDDANSCRVYDGPDGHLIGVPSIEAITSAISKERPTDFVSGDISGRRKGWLSSAAILPSIGFAFLPKLACPACWPAYAGVLSSVGLGFLLESQYLLALTASFLVVALSALAVRASTRRGYGPLGLGLVAAAAIMIGKFILGSNAIMYAGVALLVSASLWNSWPRRAAEKGSCPSCVPAEPRLNNERRYH